MNLLKSGSTLNAVLAASALIVPDQTANAAPTAGDLYVPALQWIMEFMQLKSDHSAVLTKGGVHADNSVVN